MKRFESIVVSIDGGEETTDYFRGRGTYKRILENVKHIRVNGFRGEIAARMTVMEPVNIYSEVTHLLVCGFDGVHGSSIHYSGMTLRDALLRNGFLKVTTQT